jgi:hypothetical protein
MGWLRHRGESLGILPLMRDIRIAFRRDRRGLLPPEVAALDPAARFVVLAHRLGLTETEIDRRAGWASLWCYVNAALAVLVVVGVLVGWLQPLSLGAAAYFTVGSIHHGVWSARMRHRRMVTLREWLRAAISAP